MTDTRKDLIIERWCLNSLFRFELNVPIEFVSLIAYASFRLRRADVALRPSVNVVFSLQKKGEREKEARERKGTYEWSVGQRTAKANADRDFLSVRVSYRLPASSLTCISYVPFHSPSLSLSLLHSHRTLFRQQYPFSSVTSVPASRFTSAISYLDTRRNVSGRWKRRWRAPLMDSILYQIGNRLVAVVVIRCAAR